MLEYMKRAAGYFNLLILMAKRDVSIKYSQSYFGIAWIVLQPITGMLIFTLIFTQAFLINTDEIGMPYYLFCFSGYICWILFSNIISGAGNSLIQEENLIKKVYFPRILVPASKSLNYIIDFLMGVVILLLIGTFYDISILYRIWLTMPAVILVLLNSAMIAIWLSALTIRYRDFNHVIPYIINFGIWITPVFIPLNLFPKKIRYIVELNPMTYAIELFRSICFGIPIPTMTTTFVLAQIIVLVLLFFGLRYFIKIDKLLSDYL